MHHCAGQPGMQGTARPGLPFPRVGRLLGRFRRWGAPLWRLHLEAGVQFPHCFTLSHVPLASGFVGASSLYQPNLTRFPFRALWCTAHCTAFPFRSHGRTAMPRYLLRCPQTLTSRPSWRRWTCTNGSGACGKGPGGRGTRPSLWPQTMRWGVLAALAVWRHQAGVKRG